MSKDLKARISEVNARAIALSGNAINQCVPCFVGSEIHADQLVHAVMQDPLLAAAPDCYGVLKELLDLVGIDFARIEITGVIGTTWYERAKAAIAKAEGRHE